MKTREDFQLDTTPPRSIRDIILEQISFTEYNGKTNNPLANEGVNELLTRIYRHIEAEAIKQFKSNSLWAIKAWSYENILQDTTAKEAAMIDENLLNELVSPIVDWQKGEFDPIANFKRKLKLSERSAGYIKEALRVPTKLAGKYGKKRSYSEQELLEFMAEEHDKYRTTTYVTRVRILKSFLDSLPEDEYGRRPKLPLQKIPSYPHPDELHRPVFTYKEIDKLIYWAVLEARPDVVLRLAIATIYGTRVGELAQLSSQQHIILDHENSTIKIPTEKKGRRVAQPIPTELLPLFSVPLKPMTVDTIQSHLKRLCKKAGVAAQPRMGIHAIRRSVATALLEQDGLKDLWVYRFLRWAESNLGLGVMPGYVRTPAAVSDNKVLASHPYLSMWRDMMAFLPYLEQYDSVSATYQYHLDYS
jgi:integrase